MIQALENSSHGESPGIDDYALAIGLCSLASFKENPKAVRRARGLLRELPLDERSFNDTYADQKVNVNFEQFVRKLEDWCLAYRSSRKEQKGHEALYGFLCVMLITLESLAESDKIRNTSRSLVSPGAFNSRKHDCSKICGPLMRDTAVQYAVQAIYAANSDYTIRGDPGRTHQMDDWQALDFSSLVFHRHGTTSVILRVRQHKELRALKLILFPFMRFHTITRETREYGRKYNPNISQQYEKQSPAAGETAGNAETGDADYEYEQIDVNQSGVVQVLASSERWILMKYVDGLTLAELLSYPELLEAKTATLSNGDARNRTFSEILRARLRGYTAEELRSVQADLPGIDHLRLEALLRIDRELSRKFPGRNVQQASRNLTGLASRNMREPASAHPDHPGAVAWQWMLHLGGAILKAMSDLSSLSIEGDDEASTLKIHGDLTPSNIIVNNSADLSVTLIDLGRNYFYTQSITGQGSADSAFVAPEIREGGKPGPLSDVYSVGQLIQYIGARGATPDEKVFDGYYDRTSLVARFLEDLIQEHPEQRLLIFSSAKTELPGPHVDYQELAKIHHAEIEAVIVADRYGHGLAGDNPKELLNDLIHPWSNAISRQRKVYQQVKKRRQQIQDGRFREYTWWLFFCSATATVSGAFILGVVLYWTSADLGWPYGLETLALGQKAIPGIGNLMSIIDSWIDSWRVASYHVPDWSHNWPARVVTLTFIIGAAKYYQGLFSGLMPLQGRRSGLAGWHSIATECLIRLQPIPVLVLVGITVFIQAAFWPIATAITLSILAVTNFTVWSFADRSIKDARENKISTAGTAGSRIAGLEAFQEWGPSSAFYAVMVWIIASLIYVGVLHDIAMYATAVAAINIILFYLIKGSMSGRDVRIGLARGFLAAERLRVLPEHEEPVNGPDRLAAAYAPARRAVLAAGEGRGGDSTYGRVSDGRFDGSGHCGHPSLAGH